MEGAAVTRRDTTLTAATMARVVLWVTWAWVLLDLVLLFTAFLLQLLGADPDVAFARWVYGSVERAMAPFRGIFTPIELTDRSVLDTSLLFAMVIYGFVAIVLQHLLDWIVAWSTMRRHELATRAASRSAQTTQLFGPEGDGASAGDPRRAAARYPDLVVPARGPGESTGP
jgi:uncharacterized protein YggT (Ycf19 family)